MASIATTTTDTDEIAVGVRAGHNVLIVGDHRYAMDTEAFYGLRDGEATHYPIELRGTTVRHIQDLLIGEPSMDRETGEVIFSGGVEDDGIDALYFAGLGRGKDDVHEFVMEFVKNPVVNLYGQTFTFPSIKSIVVTLDLPRMGAVPDDFIEKFETAVDYLNW